MTCYEICLFYIVGRFDFLISEPQVADSDTTGFFRVVLEVRLCIFIRIVTDDLDTVLIRTNSTVRSQSQNLQETWLAGSLYGISLGGSESPVTSSVIEIVNSFFG